MALVNNVLYVRPIYNLGQRSVSYSEDRDLLVADGNNIAGGEPDVDESEVC